MHKATSPQLDERMATEVESEEFDGLCSHPSPLSVLDVYNMTSLGHGLESNVEMVARESNIESSIKEESSVEMIGDSSEEVRAFRIYGKSERYHHQLVKSCLVLINSLKLGMVLGSFLMVSLMEKVFLCVITLSQSVHLWMG
uniref:Uncharacterized protein n=1 Tax=Populus alba TaxID=43335 RepID=A0A4U5QU74_POPAL|nr:hypothetical protein D5086_0000040830 [Populus alba]